MVTQDSECGNKAQPSPSFFVRASCCSQPSEPAAMAAQRNQGLVTCSHHGLHRHLYYAVVRIAYCTRHSETGVGCHISDLPLASDLISIASTPSLCLLLHQPPSRAQRFKLAERSYKPNERVARVGTATTAPTSCNGRNRIQRPRSTRRRNLDDSLLTRRMSKRYARRTKRSGSSRRS